MGPPQKRLSHLARKRQPRSGKAALMRDAPLATAHADLYLIVPIARPKPESSRLTV